jgi:3-oxoadipate enol-lactonase/4-carboxymuconolactone decarboxylase
LPFALNQNARLYFRIDGRDDAPPLLLLNSIGADHAMWAPVMELLLRRFRVLRMDTRGHGASDAPRGEYDLATLATDARAVLDAAGIARASVCGLSLGGMIAMRLALDAPGRVDRLVLACTSAAMPREVWIERIKLVRTQGMAAIVEAALGRFFTPAFRAANPGTVASMRRTIETTDAEGYAACGAAIRDMDLLAHLGAIRAPTLVIAGAHDVSTPIEGHADRLVAAISGARLVVLPTAHIACAEAPDAFASALAGHLGDAPAPDSVGEARATLFAAGLVQRRQVLGDAWVDASFAKRNAFNADFQDLITRNAWSEIWTRPGLDHRTRRLLVLAMTAALGRWEEFRLHARAGLERGGLARDELKELILQAAVYCGMPVGNTAMHHAEAIIAELDAHAGKPS